MKRLLDLVVSIIFILLLSPVFVLIAIAILTTDGFPILFGQVRVGRDLKTFQIYKFRTMKNGSAKGDIPSNATQAEIQASRAAYQTTTRNDPRITPVGHFLRKTSLDELPQLINVIKGEMSLVGPRPMVPAQQVDWDSSYWQDRHKVHPGITGLAQINGRSSISREKLIECDLDYAQSPGALRDLEILIKTAMQILRMTGNA